MPAFIPYEIIWVRIVVTVFLLVSLVVFVYILYLYVYFPIINAITESTSTISQTLAAAGQPDLVGLEQDANTLNAALQSDIAVPYASMSATQQAEFAAALTAITNESATVNVGTDVQPCLLLASVAADIQSGVQSFEDSATQAIDDAQALIDDMIASLENAPDIIRCAMVNFIRRCADCQANIEGFDYTNICPPAWPEDFCWCCDFNPTSSCCMNGSFAEPF